MVARFQKDRKTHKAFRKMCSLPPRSTPAGLLGRYEVRNRVAGPLGSVVRCPARAAVSFLAASESFAMRAGDKNHSPAKAYSAVAVKPCSRPFLDEKGIAKQLRLVPS